MVQGGFIYGDEDFNRELEYTVTAKGSMKKSLYMCKRISSVSSWALKDHETLKHTQRVPPKQKGKIKNNYRYQ